MYTKNAFLKVDINLSIDSSVRSRRCRNKQATDVVSYIRISYGSIKREIANGQQCIGSLSPHSDSILLKQRDALQLVFRIPHNCDLFAHIMQQTVGGKRQLQQTHKYLIFRYPLYKYLPQQFHRNFYKQYPWRGNILPEFCHSQLPKEFLPSAQHYRSLTW